MSDKLNKFSFLAGKFFAKTVNDLRVVEKEVEVPRTVLQPILDPEEKIKKVLEILNSKEVGKNIDNLINRYLYKSDEILYSPGDLYQSSSSSSSTDISKEILEELGIKEINKNLNFAYKGKVLKILLTNHTSGSFPDGDYYDNFGLIVLYNGVCVLKHGVSRHFDTYGSTYRTGNFSSTSLESFKNGSWIDDLEYLIKNFDDFQQKRELIEEVEKRKTLAEKLDLNPLD